MTEWKEHYNTGRAHMGLDGRAPADDPNLIPFPTARVQRHPRCTDPTIERHSPQCRADRAHGQGRA
jgi:hypothetical protein